MDALIVDKLCKTYTNGPCALDNVSFSVEQGDFFALLGPNGAGKSTLISILASLATKTSGKVSILGNDLDRNFTEAKLRMGLVPQEMNFSIFYKVEQILLNQAGYYGISRSEALPRVEKYLKKLDLWEKRDAQAKALSGGMKRRLMIARALVHEPDILILDEPTAGVDIELRRLMWDFLLDLNREGKTIILTTHYLEEAEYLCRNIAIIDRGKLIERSTMSDLLKSLDSERFVLYLAQPLDNLPDISGYPLCKIDDQTLEVEVSHTANLSQLFDALSRHKIQVNSMRNKVNRLEELFLRLTAGKKDER